MIARLMAGSIGVCLLAAGLLAPGLPAQEGKKKEASIAGRVTLKGQPFPKGKVTFHPDKGKSASTGTIADGTYSLKRVPAGKLRVTIEGKGVAPMFKGLKTTPLVVEAKPGQNQFDIELP